MYDARDEMTLISELATGGELLDTVTQEKYITEIEVARIVIQGRTDGIRFHSPWKSLWKIVTKLIETSFSF